MDKKAKLQFNEDGTECKVVFANDAESIIYKSKVTLLEALFDMVKNQKINPEELSEMAREVVEAKNLLDDSKTKNVTIEVTSVHVTRMDTPSGTGFGGNLLETLMSADTMKEIASLQNEEVKEPEFRISVVDPTYGWIILPTMLLGNRIKTKHIGLEALEALEKAGEISKGDRDKLTKDIDASNLPKV